MSTEPGELQSNLKRSIEFLGQHPFATGLLALLGICGFVFSVVGFWYDRDDASDTNQQIIAVQERVDEVKKVINSNCSSPECLTLVDLVQPNTVGRSKDFLDSKLPPAEYVRNNQPIYDIDGCEVRIEYSNNSVSYISSALFKIEKNESGKSTKVSCAIEMPKPRLTDNTADGASHTGLPPEENKLATVRDILKTTHDDIRISIACIDCGNFSEPFVEAYAFGSHAEDNIDQYFTVAYAGYSDSRIAYRAWSEMQENFDAVGPDPDEHNVVETTDYCGSNISTYLEPVMDFSVERIGYGRGVRVWAGPDVLFCR